MNGYFSRKLPLALIVIALIVPAGMESKPSRGKGGRAKKQAVKALRPKPVDPELQWKECGDSCVSEIFGGAVAPVRISPVKGTIRGAAVNGENVYLLVEDFNLVTDAILILKRESGRLQSVWGIGRHRAAAISSDGQFLWVMSRSEKYFLRKLTLGGKGAGDFGLSPLPEGALSGFACGGGNFVFTVQGGETSDLYRYEPGARRARKIFSTRGLLPAVAISQDSVLAYHNEFDTYSNSWLLMISLAGELKKKISFINAVPACFSSDGKNMYMMEKRDSGFLVYPFTLRNDGRIVLANPRVRSVDLTYPVTGRNGNSFTADLWVPYPSNRNYQNVRKVSIDPKPREILSDKFGNRWARIRWDKASGSVKAILHFDIITAASACTLDRNYIFRPVDVPAEIQSASLQETGAFDISNYIIKSHATRIQTDGPGVSRLMEIQKYVNANVSYSEQEFRWGRASEYLFKGRGDEYGHAVSFAAVSRFLGFPARAAGGLTLEDTGRTGGDMTAVWGQAYLPGTGWIDVGCGEGRSGGPPGSVAFRPNTYYITFEGDFDKLNYSSVFTETDWYGTCRWSSVDERKKADVALGKVQISVRELAE